MNKLLRTYEKTVNITKIEIALLFQGEGAYIDRLSYQTICNDFLQRNHK